MWWPRPRWKTDDILSVYFALLFTVVTNASVAMADDGRQRCDESNTSAVIWTTALCTTLLILVIVAVYFAYCKRKEHDWSSLWWKNNPDKNIVLQTSSPTKFRRQKIDGTDNPSFSADSNFDDSGAVGTAITRGSTKTVHVPSSTVADNGLMEIDLSIKEEDGRQIYMCKQNDGSKERVVALRLVFDNKDTAQPNFGRASDLSRSVTELVRDYGLHVELETEAAAANTSPRTAEAVENSDGGGSNDTEKPSVKSNILSAVRGTARRLWNQKELVFKSSGGNCNGRVHQEDANKKQNCSGAVDVENGHASSSAVAVADADAAAVSPTREKSPCSTVTVVNETVQKSSADRLQYRTLEYGASPADMDAQPSPECSIQCGTVIDSLEPVRTVTSLTSAAPAAAAVTTENDPVATSECYVTAQVPAMNCSDGTVVVTVDDDDAKNHVKPNVNNVDESSNKHAAANPPPPPPRKYYVSTVPPVVPTAVTTPGAVPTVTETTNTLQHIAPNHSTVTPGKASPSSSPSDNSEIPVVVPDDYYWCTTTVMAPPVLSTFGKRLSAAETAGDEKEEEEEEERENIIRRVGNSGEAEKTGTCNGGGIVAVVEQLHIHGGSNAVTGGVTMTTSIEDASLPSFSSDEDDEDNGVFVEKMKSQCSAVADNALEECNSTVNGVVGKRNNGDGKETVIKVISGQPGRYNNTTEDCAVSPPVGAAGKEPKSPTTKLPTLRQQSSPPVTTANNTSTYFGSSSASSSSSSSSPSSPTNHGGNNNNNSPIVSKIPVRRQSAGSAGGGGGTTVVSSPLTNGTGKKSIPLPLSRSGSRLAMWSSAN